MKNLGLLSTVIIALFISSCAKDGAPGATGPQGPTGNANVASRSFTISNWAYVSPSWFASVSYSAITQDIVDNGAVLVYASNGSGGYSQLPITVYPTSSYSKSYSVVYTTGSFAIYVTDSDLTQPVNPGSMTFKVVVVAASAKKEMENRGVNFESYEEVVSNL